MSEYLFKTDKEIKTCNECPMSEQLKIENCYYCNLLHDIAKNNTKNSDCPLVEVPTHGDWHTGTPTEYGFYLVQYIHGGYDVVLYDPSASGWDIYTDDSPKDIVAWQKIEPYRGRQ